MITFDHMIREAVLYLEMNMRCAKHRVEHTGSSTYLLDIYSYLNEVEKGKALVETLMKRIVRDGDSWIFYPGLMNMMNMSNNVIDCGSAVDTIARFLRTHAGAFSADEHAAYAADLKKVVDSYLESASRTKRTTNQRLWGLTGVASYAKYVKETSFAKGAEESIKLAFSDMTTDGFFRYFPDAEKNGTFAGYDDITTFYQSRCTAFIRYVLGELGIPVAPHEARLEESTKALLAMYSSEGIKDLRLECKRWYWLSRYEVASHAFDAYTLAYSSVPEAKTALHNVLYQIRKHFYDGYLHSHQGASINFQCPIFWTAHLAWLTRIPDIAKTFDRADSTKPFSYEFKGKEVYTKTTSAKRALVNARWQKRNPTVGIYANGLEGDAKWHWRFPQLPPAFLHSLREVLNHTWYALRGGYIREAFLRIFFFKLECFVMLLPRYKVGYGKVTSLTYRGDEVHVEVQPATKYGTTLDARVRITL